MFNEYLKQTNSKTVEYFETLLKSFYEGKKNIPNSIILWGSDVLAQYFFALDLARNLNCKKDKSIDCDCLNCNWIRNNTHPEIKTVSKIDYKPEDDATKVISVKQIQNLLSEINIKSEDYRVVIFCDADYEKISDEKKSHIEKFEELKTAISQKGEKYWIPKPLDSKTFKEEASNSLLKTIEETPKNLLFVFLTSSPDDLISTIISRSQMFYIQNTFMPDYDYSFCQELLKSFPNTDKDDFDEFSQKSLKYMKEKELHMQSYLELLQAYFTKLFASNCQNPAMKEKILFTIKEIIKAKKYDLASIKAQSILDDLWIKIAN